MGRGMVAAGPDAQRRGAGTRPAALGPQVQADLLHQHGRDATGPELRPDHVAHRGRAAVWVGLDFYRYVLEDPRFWHSLRVGLTYSAMVVLLCKHLMA